MFHFQRLLLLSLSFFLLSCGLDGFNQGIYKVKYQKGDHGDWAAKSYDDSLWTERYPYSDPPEESSIWWLRQNFNFNERIHFDQPTGVAVIAIASFDLYIDGILVGSNGKPGSSIDKEIVGKYSSLFLIPDSLLTHDEHTIAIRFSHHQLPDFYRFHGIYFGDFKDMAKIGLFETSMIHILAGFFLIVGIYYLLIYFIDRRKLSTLLFASLCLSFFSLIIFEYIKFYYLYDYPYHLTRLIIIKYLTFLIALLLPSYYLVRFNMSFNKMLIIIYIATLIFISTSDLSFDTASVALFTVAACTTLVISILTVYHKKVGSTLALIGIICIFPSILFDYDLMLFTGFTAIIFFLLISLTIQAKIDRIEKEAATNRSVILENALLKKNIQPYFLMNSLTSLMDWVEEDPKSSVQFIDTLANESRLLLTVADQTTIPLQQEIELCKAHLKNMSFRKNSRFDLSLTGLKLEGQIPPAILHTCVENGLSHQIFAKGDHTFILHIESRENKIVFKLTSPGNVKDKFERKPDGTGFKYIKSRLEESYSGEWALNAYQENEHWITEIEIPARHFNIEVQ